jgi:hypothetical protein
MGERYGKSAGEDRRSTRHPRIAAALRLVSVGLLLLQVLLVVASLWAAYRLTKMPCGPEPGGARGGTGVILALLILVLQVAPATGVAFLVRRAGTRRTSGGGATALAVAALGVTLGASTLTYILLLALGC